MTRAKKVLGNLFFLCGTFIIRLANCPFGSCFGNFWGANRIHAVCSDIGSCAPKSSCSGGIAAMADKCNWAIEL